MRRKVHIYIYKISPSIKKLSIKFLHLTGSVWRFTSKWVGQALFILFRAKELFRGNNRKLLHPVTLSEQGFLEACMMLAETDSEVDEIKRKLES